ncbi:hypothetical protein CCR75_007192 [Bremia lactucae]|uniref:Uncharacterized protein n=1 Tax=Bremia lactucae TaxID=4779 RepID=A0A976IC47_BRELC|nr:hypothetical protein CCR75_007192 [Bremia lactucae]
MIFQGLNDFQLTKNVTAKKCLVVLSAETSSEAYKDVGAIHRNVDSSAKEACEETVLNGSRSAKQPEGRSGGADEGVGIAEDQQVLPLVRM